MINLVRRVFSHMCTDPNSNHCLAQPSAVELEHAVRAGLWM